MRCSVPASLCSTVDTGRINRSMKWKTVLFINNKRVHQTCTLETPDQSPKEIRGPGTLDTRQTIRTISRFNKLISHYRRRGMRALNW